jgi:transposase
MEICWDRCAGIDLGKKSLVVCLLTGRQKTVRTYLTTTADLTALRDWLTAAGCQAVAMEATGSYWKPVWNVLEDHGMALLLANPQRIKAIPGRKSDVRDAEWIADLLQHGLVPASYVPDRAQRELRELTRYRTSLVQDRAREVNRLAKVLEGGNIKLGTVLTDLTGKTGRAMLRALARGEDDLEVLLRYVVGPVKASADQLVAALTGILTPHQRFLIGTILDGIEGLETRIAALEAAIATQLTALAAPTALLQTAPGVGVHASAVCVAEIGTTVAAFPSAAHLSAWAGLAPGQNESAGKRKSARIPPGQRHLRTVLVQCAWAAVHQRHTYLAAQFAHLQPRLGKKRAIVAVAHSLLVSLYAMLRDGVPYADLGPAHFDSVDHAAVRRRAVRQLERQGYQVTLTRSTA